MFYKTINTIKLSYLLKKKNLIKKFNKKEFVILNIFIKLNIIKLIKNNKKKINIYFQYINNEPVFKNIKNMYKPSKPVFLNYKQIKKINKKNNFIFYISTNKGVISNFEAEKFKIGGTLVFQVKI